MKDNIKLSEIASIHERIELPQTDFTRTIPVNVYDSKVFLGKRKSQIDILEMVNKYDEAKHWKTLLESANELLNVNSK